MCDTLVVLPAWQGLYNKRPLAALLKVALVCFSLSVILLSGLPAWQEWGGAFWGVGLHRRVIGCLGSMRHHWMFVGAGLLYSSALSVWFGGPGLL